MKVCRVRGSAFVTVLAVLTLLSILMEIGLALVVSHITESRRRGDAAYAGELARSGLEWARAQIAGGSESASGRLQVQGGVIEVTSRRDGEMIAVTSKGTVMRGEARGPSREASTRVRPPDPGSVPPAASSPPAEPAPPRQPDPVAQELGEGGTAPQPAPAPEQPRAPDPTTELQGVHP